MLPTFGSRRAQVPPGRRLGAQWRRPPPPSAYPSHPLRYPPLVFRSMAPRKAKAAAANQEAAADGPSTSGGGEAAQQSKVVYIGCVHRLPQCMRHLLLPDGPQLCLWLCRHIPHGFYEAQLKGENLCLPPPPPGRRWRHQQQGSPAFADSLRFHMQTFSPSLAR